MNRATSRDGILIEWPRQHRSRSAMPSPFPGMDPYLEGPEWTSFHAALAVEICRQLTPRLRPRYVARPEKRLLLSTAEVENSGSASPRSLRPDAAVLQSAGSQSQAGLSSVGAASVTMAPAPLRLVTSMPIPVPQYTVEIQEVPKRRLVTAIEILSPTNKHRMGRKAYLKRRRKLLMSSAHLIELDLLRRGRRVPMSDALPEQPYFIVLSRAEARPVVEVWPIGFD